VILDELPEARELYRRAAKTRFASRAQSCGPVLLDRRAIEALLPHRDPCLLLDRVMWIDYQDPLIVARYDLARGAAVFAGHFPGRPVWPGMLQLEAITQAGLLFGLHRDPATRDQAEVALTEVVAARFLLPVSPGADLEIAVRVLEDGLFHVLVGQCLSREAICSVAVLRGL
jgi:3-hydroxyacyl-[acyl-carrier-protein] dehydratase